MTFFEWIRDCLRQEALRMAPGCRDALQKIMEGYHAKGTDSHTGKKGTGR